MFACFKGGMCIRVYPGFPLFARRTCSYFLWFEFYSRWKWSTYLVCTVWASWKLLMRRDHLTPENNISSDSARNSVITCNYVKLRHVSHTPEHGNIARRAEGSWFLSSWYDVPLSLSCKIIQRIQVWQVFVQIICRVAADAMNPHRNCLPYMT